MLLDHRRVSAGRIRRYVMAEERRCGNCANRCSRNRKGFWEDCFVYMMTKSLDDERRAASICRKYTEETSGGEKTPFEERVTTVYY